MTWTDEDQRVAEEVWDHTNTGEFSTFLDGFRAATERERLRREGVDGKRLVEEVDQKAQQMGPDEDGFITGYILPVGPWHRLLAWARG